jgi:hypothetical protein
MKTYRVHLEPSSVYGKNVDIEAESMDEAIKIAREKHCGKEMVEVSYHPDWLQPKPEDADEDWECYEYWHEIYHDCDDCGIVLFESHGDKRNPDNDWPWQHDAGDTRHQTYICYPCAMKRKEEGNYCPFFKHFYRSYKEGCDKCPPECHRARDAYYEALGAVLTRALYHSDAPKRGEEKNVAEFLEANELGLAYETLKECGPLHDPDSRFDKNMEKADEMMKKGWE